MSGVDATMCDDVAVDFDGPRAVDYDDVEPFSVEITPKSDCSRCFVFVGGEVYPVEDCVAAVPPRSRADGEWRQRVVLVGLDHGPVTLRRLPPEPGWRVDGNVLRDVRDCAVLPVSFEGLDVVTEDATCGEARARTYGRLTGHSYVTRTSEPYDGHALVVIGCVVLAAYVALGVVVALAIWCGREDKLKRR